MRTGRTAPGWHGPTPERLRLADEVRRLRADGMLQVEVASELGISKSYVSELERDPTGEAGRARKDSYAAPCVECGAPTSGSEGRKKRPLCIPCGNVEAAKVLTVWTREAIISAIQWWNVMYGRPPAMHDFNPRACRTELRDETRAERAERHIREGYIPWVTTVVTAFGTWNAGIEAAGFSPRQSGGVKENQLRRRARVRA